ncbi:glycerophosphoryl diester phosphodiesterase [Bacillus ectoiniformans]|uniref:glycerophosphodiester phosphodiesterase n=1 Tax=Bacillus ectoiniformans TaxID=1494429 RepID=UPI001957F275|nr:glycerophosphodiester phosphodiesterase [Bacillus ectoiniformans]MBM7648123.1 glycerophosphoryl diester phosphodiesterase [Bacillus ectoiniformans]
MTLIFGHRGYSLIAPENTMTAFIKAEQAGAEGIELDVQLTKDGELAVIHDEKVDRTTNGKGYVKDYLAQDLQKLDASYTFKGLEETPRIPLLREVFEWMKNNEIICNIELKNNELPYEGMEEKVIQLIREYHYEQRVIISSFNHYSLTHFYQLAPDIETAPLYSSNLYMPWTYAQAIRAKAIHPNIRTLNNHIIQSSLESGVSVRPYTVNKEKQMRWLIEQKCSAFFTDDPKKALAVRKEIVGR